jgi:hypothetical protein
VSAPAPAGGPVHGAPVHGAVALGWAVCLSCLALPVRAHQHAAWSPWSSVHQCTLVHLSSPSRLGWCVRAQEGPDFGLSRPERPTPSWLDVLWACTLVLLLAMVIFVHRKLGKKTSKRVKFGVFCALCHHRGMGALGQSLRWLRRCLGLVMPMLIPQ